VIQAIPKPLTFEEYQPTMMGLITATILSAGHLAMPPSTGQHADIAEFLNDKFRAHIKQRTAAGIEAGAFAVQLPPTEGGILAEFGRMRSNCRAVAAAEDRSTAIALEPTSEVSCRSCQY